MSDEQAISTRFGRVVPVGGRKRTLGDPTVKFSLACADHLAVEWRQPLM